MANTEQLLSTGIGAAVGFFIGGPAGALAGARYGFLAGSVLFPAELPSVTGPRLEDFERGEADPGAAVWKVYGAYPVPGFRLYLGPVTEVANSETHGGKGAPEQNVTTFTYYQTLAVGLCEGEITGIVRIWENGELVYDVRPQQDGEADADYNARIAASAVYSATFTLYTGTTTQTADPTIEAELGAGNVPGYRGLAYLVFPNRQLQSDQGSRHPQFKVEINGIAGEEIETTILYLEDDVFEKPAGLTSVDVFVVAGGGGAGSGCHYTGGGREGGGGGGGGEYRTANVLADSLADSEVITVGAGGLGGAGVVGDVDGNPGADGGDSSFGAHVVAIGGGGGEEGEGNAASAHHAEGGDGGTGGTGGTGVDGGAGGRSAVTAAGGFVAGGNPGAASTRGGGGGGGGGIRNSGGPALGNPSGGAGNTSGTSRAGGTGSEGAAGTPGTDAEPLTTLSEAGGGGGGGGGDTGEFSDATGFGKSGGNGGFGGGGGAGGGSAGEGDASGSSGDGGDGGDGYVLLMLNGDFSNSGLITIAEIITRICADIGLTDIDVSDYEDQYVIGYAVSRHMDARSALEGLRLVAAFDYVESGTTLAFRKRGEPIVAQLEDSELGARFSDEPPVPRVTTQKLQDFELPRQIRLQYLSYAKDYEVSETLSPQRLNTISSNDVSIQTSVVLTEQEAAQVADVAFRDAWTSRHVHTWSTTVDRTELEPADPIELAIDDRTRRVRIVSIDDSALGLRKYTGVRDDDGTYVSTAIAVNPPTVNPGLAVIGVTSFELLDLPALDEEDDNAGLYLACWRSGVGTAWNGASLHRSIDGGSVYNQIATIDTQATIGTVVTAPASLLTTTWENADTLVLDMLNEATLESRTDAAVLAGANTLAVGAHGRWCLIQFANAELIATDRFELSRLLLGRRGTEHNLPLIQPGDRAILVSGSGIYKLGLQISQIGQEFLYRAATVGTALSAAADVPFTGAGQRLWPFSGVYGDGERDSAGDLTITWIRRDRISETLRDGVPVSMSEDVEAYEIDILDGTTVVRTIEGLSSPAAVYTAAEQTTDFGSPQDPVTGLIYQISAQTGRGTPLEFTL